MAVIESKQTLNSARGIRLKRVDRTLNPSTSVEDLGVAGDDIQLATIPAGAVILEAHANVITADSAAADFDLDASAGTATGQALIANGDATSTGIIAGVITGPLLATAEWNLKLKFNTNMLTDGVLQVTVAYEEPHAGYIEGGQIAPGSEK